jgi:FkbM family methyltransferase
VNLRRVIYLLLPNWLRQLLRKRKVSWRLATALSTGLPHTLCVDVGASYYPHTKWLVFLNSPNTQWLVVEPNTANMGYVKAWTWPCHIDQCATGLSREGGKQTLYVTNVDSGSSLLPPEIPEGMQHRVSDLDYFFPVIEKEIETITLVEAVANYPVDAPIIVKLDTQGTELSILMGAHSLFENHRIIGIEMESTLLATPVMKGSGRFWQACEFLEAEGFELLQVKPFAASARTGRVKPGNSTYVGECDAVFAVRPDIAALQSVEHRVVLFGFYLTYQFYEEGLSLLERDAPVRKYLEARGVSPEKLKGMLEAAL